MFSPVNHTATIDCGWEERENAPNGSIPNDSPTLISLIREESRRRSALEEALVAIQRLHGAIQQTNDGMCQQWFTFANTMERHGLHRLNLLEQCNIEMVFFWVKECILRVQILALFALCQPSPTLSMLDRRKWCLQGFHALSDWCAATL